MSYPELSYYQWKALSLVNEKCVATKETICHLMYGRQTAVAHVEKILDSLWDLGLVTNRGDYHNYKYMTTEAGDDYIENAIKPVKSFEKLLK